MEVSDGTGEGAVGTYIVDAPYPTALYVLMQLQNEPRHTPIRWKCTDRVSKKHTGCDMYQNALH